MSLNPSRAVPDPCIPSPCMSSTHQPVIPLGELISFLGFAAVCRGFGIPWGWRLWPFQPTLRTSSLWKFLLFMNISNGEAVWANTSREKLEFKSSWMLLALVGPPNTEEILFSWILLPAFPATGCVQSHSDLAFNYSHLILALLCGQSRLLIAQN